MSYVASWAPRHYYRPVFASRWCSRLADRAACGRAVKLHLLGQGVGIDGAGAGGQLAEGVRATKQNGTKSFSVICVASRSRLVPIIRTVLEEFVPDAKDAIEMVNGRSCLVDGTITPAGPTRSIRSCGVARRARPGSTRGILMVLWVVLSVRLALLARRSWRSCATIVA